VLVGAIALASVMLDGAPRAAASDGRELGRVTARAAMVLDAQTGAVYFARNATDPLPPASTTKLLTALIALRTLSPDTPLSVSAYASSMPATKAYLRTGWQLTARDVLYAMLMRSANDASVVVAENVAGSVPAFARMMNTTARSLGATESNFVTPNGLPNADHYSTARDMALILREGLRTPGLRDVLSTRTTAIQPLVGSRKRIALRSTNRLLWRDDLHVIGKTGWTREARRCFVGMASANGHEVIVSVLGSNDIWSDVETLAVYGLEQAAPGTDWRDRAGWEQAAAQPQLGTAWSRPGGELDEVAEVAPPAGAIDRRRGMRMAAVVPPALSTGRSGRRTARAQAQGDGVDLHGATMRYAIDLGSYRSRVRADQLSRELAKRGYHGQVVAVGGTYRVRLANFESRDAARKTARVLERTFRLEPVIVAAK
jgi:D-alanyl-D-alanine carboxypeptidase (penicillin-binding protein 5/6)